MRLAASRKKKEAPFPCFDQPCFSLQTQLEVTANWACLAAKKKLLSVTCATAA